MKKTYYILLTALMLFGSVKGQTVADFSLPSTSGSAVALSSFNAKKAVVVIFSSNHCVYSKKYEERIVNMAKENAAKNVQFLVINSNDAEIAEEESMAQMKKRATEKGYSFPYLKDVDQSVAKSFKATKTPQAYVLVPNGSGFKIVYNGVIDDNALMANRVQKKYLDQAISDVLSGGSPQTATTSPVGCSIKWK